MRIVWLQLVFIVFIIVIFSPYSLQDDDPSCFQVTTQICFEALKNGTKCTKISTDIASSQMFCCNITDEKEITNYITKFTTNERGPQIYGFHLRDSNISRLTITIFGGLPDLSSLSITENSVTKFEGIFQANDKLSCLNISRNGLTEFSPQVISRLKSLRNLDMSNNNISFIPEIPPNLPSFFKLDLSENKQLLCKHLINLTLMIDDKSIALNFVNKNFTYCLPPNYKLFDSIAHIKMENLETIKVIFRDCPFINGSGKCECNIHSLDQGPNKQYVYYASVNCSNKQMTSLPKVLPPNTKLLDISDNNITTLEGIGNETYSTIRELLADNNQIMSLKHLEGTSFFDNFQNLTLRNNKIDQIQDYLLSNVFDRNLGKRIFLAKNKLKCDCHTASHIKLWLVANRKHIPDYEQIFAVCEPEVKVLDMDQKYLCSKPTTWKDYIRYIIILEVTLFILLFGKVSYDYYIFKTAGYLPWPASKIPKLPCDWCFET